MFLRNCLTTSMALDFNFVDNTSGTKTYIGTIEEAAMVLSRFSSGLFGAIIAVKEIRNGNKIHRRVSA